MLPFLPVIQGCHEYFVGAVQSGRLASEPWSTVCGAPGCEAFQQSESCGLDRGAQFFLGSRWENEYLSWLGRLFPQTPPEEVARRLSLGGKA